MKIFVNTKPNARQNGVVKVDDTHFEVSVKEPPTNGRANVAVIKVVAEYFDVAPSLINIVSGRASRNKVLEVPI